MKQIKLTALLLMFAFLICRSSAQTGTEAPSTVNPENEDISAARRRYLQPTNIAADEEANRILAQMRRGGRGPLPRSGTYHNRQPYQSPWADRDPGRVLLGAAIGFGVGAAVGAVGSIHNHTPVGGGIAIGGSLFALFGAAIGSSHPYSFALHHRTINPAVTPADQEEIRAAHSRHDADESAAMRLSTPVKAAHSQSSGLSEQASLSQPTSLLP